MRRLLLAAACTALLSVPGCSVTLDGPPAGGPECPTGTAIPRWFLNSPLLLAAQSVPTAALVPCLHALPAGWTFNEMSARNGQTRMVLDLGPGGGHAATVTLSRSCDIAHALQSASDQAGTHRYDRVEDAQSGYRADRYYVFRGGCVRYDFDVHGTGAAVQAETLARTFGFVDRDTLGRYVDELSHGRFQLDPTPVGTPR
jgi:hypothetical protein